MNSTDESAARFDRPHLSHACVIPQIITISGILIIHTLQVRKISFRKLVFLCCEYKWLIIASPCSIFKIAVGLCLLQYRMETVHGI